VRLDLNTAEPVQHSKHDVETAHTAGDEDDVQEAAGLLAQSPTEGSTTHSSLQSSPTSSRGLTPHDILAAFTSPKIWLLLFLNTLSAIPVTAFSVFLPLILSHLSQRSQDTPALTNLLTAPPFLCGALSLYAFTAWSDKTHQRTKPILLALALIIAGLALVVLLPTHWPIPRYISLCLLLSGTFVPSPLIVAWLANNTPSPGKRALVLGINGWGNFAGVLSALLFKSTYGPTYAVPFAVTVAAVGVAAAGFAGVWRQLRAENAWREGVVRGWDDDDVAAERAYGKGPYKVPESSVLNVLVRGTYALGEVGLRVRRWVEEAREAREGDERLTFRYGA